MSGSFQVGAVILFHNYEFDDGTSKPKFLVLLGMQADGHCLLALTTSKQHYMVNDPGCTQNPRTYYFIKGKEKNCFFPKDTWVLLHDPKIMTTADLMSFGMANQIEIKHCLNENKIGHIRNCLKYSDDVADIHLEICGFK